ncbi:hypothetical protein F7D16_02580 [Brucella melitensis]|uniref:hypothetical protein n=1 Tax=Brucella melitensis TaxID=29459 RepID=UPI0012449291|nr:hypothetical protein [Brucella melitensis]QEX86549.1 hypothetical protein F7D16_02580 [Brucella melitensis]
MRHIGDLLHAGIDTNDGRIIYGVEGGRCARKTISGSWKSPHPADHVHGWSAGRMKLLGIRSPSAKLDASTRI